jgi:hypothetical protein
MNALIPGTCTACKERVEVGNEIVLDIDNEPMHIEHVPVRLCCGGRHWGSVCRDNKVMCSLCWERVDIEALHVDPATGDTYDICKPCATGLG